MTLIYSLENLDGVDETHRGLYKEAETGGFVLDVQGAVSRDKFNEVNQLRVDLSDRVGRKERQVSRVLQKLGLEDAGGLDAAIDDLLSSKKGGKPDADHEKIIAQIKQSASDREKELLGKIKEIQLSGAKSKLAAGLAEVGFPLKLVDSLAQMHMNRVQLDESGEIRIMSDKGDLLAGNGSDGFATFGDLSKELAAAMPEFLADKGKGGGGKPPASGADSGAKTVTRSEFDAMSHPERADFSKSGGKVTD